MDADPEIAVHEVTWSAPQAEAHLDSFPAGHAGATAALVGLLPLHEGTTFTNRLMQKARGKGGKGGRSWHQVVAIVDKLLCGDSRAPALTTALSGTYSTFQKAHDRVKAAQRTHAKHGYGTDMEILLGSPFVFPGGYEFSPFWEPNSDAASSDQRTLLKIATRTNREIEEEMAAAKEAAAVAVALAEAAVGAQQETEAKQHEAEQQLQAAQTEITQLRAGLAAAAAEGGAVSQRGGRSAQRDHAREQEQRERERQEAAQEEEEREQQRREAEATRPRSAGTQTEFGLGSTNVTYVGGLNEQISALGFMVKELAGRNVELESRQRDLHERLQLSEQSLAVAVSVSQGAAESASKAPSATRAAAEETRALKTAVLGPYRASEKSSADPSWYVGGASTNTSRVYKQRTKAWYARMGWWTLLAENTGRGWQGCCEHIAYYLTKDPERFAYVMGVSRVRVMLERTINRAIKEDHQSDRAMSESLVVMFSQMQSRRMILALRSNLFQLDRGDGSLAWQQYETPLGCIDKGCPFYSRRAYTEVERKIWANEMKMTVGDSSHLPRPTAGPDSGPDMATITTLELCKSMSYVVQSNPRLSAKRVWFQGAAAVAACVVAGVAALAYVAVAFDLFVFKVNWDGFPLDKKRTATELVWSMVNLLSGTNAPINIRTQALIIAPETDPTVDRITQQMEMEYVGLVRNLPPYPTASYEFPGPRHWGPKSEPNKHKPPPGALNAATNRREGYYPVCSGDLKLHIHLMGAGGQSANNYGLWCRINKQNHGRELLNGEIGKGEFTWITAEDREREHGRLVQAACRRMEKDDANGVTPRVYTKHGVGEMAVLCENGRWCQDGCQLGGVQPAPGKVF
jgi:hypothetical protein